MPTHPLRWRPVDCSFRLARETFQDTVYLFAEVPRLYFRAIILYHFLQLSRFHRNAPRFHQDLL